MSVTLAELEARIAALEADRADYKEVLTTVNVLGQQTRERDDATAVKIERSEERLAGRIDRVADRQDEINARVRSIEENVAELKDLLIRALDQP
jgi:hypothetical protein